MPAPEASEPAETGKVQALPSSEGKLKVKLRGPLPCLTGSSAVSIAAIHAEKTAESSAKAPSLSRVVVADPWWAALDDLEPALRGLVRTGQLPTSAARKDLSKLLQEALAARECLCRLLLEGPMKPREATQLLKLPQLSFRWKQTAVDASMVSDGAVLTSES